MSIQDPEFPYNEKTQIEIKEFYTKIAGKTKKTDKFIYKISDSGNLELYSKETNELSSTIPLYYYRAYSKEEFDEMDRKRIEAIVTVESEIDIQKNILRKAVFANDISEVLRINEEIRELEMKKVQLRSPVRDTITMEGISKKLVFFDQPYEERKAEILQQTIYRDFPLWKLYGKYTDSREVLEASEQKKISLEEGQVFLTSGSIGRLIYEPGDSVNGLLSIFLFRDFIHKGTQYSSAYQAFEANRLAELGYDDLRTNVLKTRALKTIRFVGMKIQKASNNTKQLWKTILTDYYTQNKDLIDNLLSTNNDVLVLNSDIPYIGGIGYKSGDEASTNISKWKAFKFDTNVLKPNIVGEVLSELRSEFREANKEDIVKVGGAVEERTQTEEDVKKAKKAAIINNLRNRVHF
jgi:predicted NAD-dependent protein-ADP-ribosyltransferase YbiA (DUF1768 family)